MWVKNIQFFFYFTAAESYFQKLSKNFSTNFAETANKWALVEKKFLSSFRVEHSIIIKYLEFEKA